MQSSENDVAPPEPHGKLVLVVDDDEATLRVLRISIDLSGHSSVVASTREKAIEAVKEEAPDLIMMDYRMAGMEPDTFIATVRESGFTGPIVLCTAMDQNPGLEVDDVLLKPFEPDELIARLQALLA